LDLKNKKQYRGMMGNKKSGGYLPSIMDVKRTNSRPRKPLARIGKGKGRTHRLVIIGVN
jgi:hypothetical protein